MSRTLSRVTYIWHDVVHIPHCAHVTCTYHMLSYMPPVWHILRLCTHTTCYHMSHTYHMTSHVTHIMHEYWTHSIGMLHMIVSHFHLMLKNLSKIFHRSHIYFPHISPPLFFLFFFLSRPLSPKFTPCPPFTSFSPYPLCFSLSFPSQTYFLPPP